MAADSQNLPNAKKADTLFRQIIIVSTALSLAVMYGWLAGFDRQANGDFNFHWRWNGLLWAIIGAASTLFFWRKIWPPKNAATRNDIVIGSIILGGPGIWWLTFPLRFLSGQHFWDVMTGLIAAALVLSFGAWMVIKLIQAFERSDAEDSVARGDGKINSDRK